MGRPKLDNSAKRVGVKIFVSPALLDWVDNNSGEGKRFYNRTHAFEFGVARLMEGESDPVSETAGEHQSDER